MSLDKGLLRLQLVYRSTVQRLASSHDSRVTPVSTSRRTEPCSSPATQDSGRYLVSLNIAVRRQTHQRVTTAPVSQSNDEAKRPGQAAVVLAYQRLERSPHHCRAHKSALGALTVFFKWLKANLKIRSFSRPQRKSRQGADIYFALITYPVACK